jgi:hypothetical protein
MGRPDGQPAQPLADATIERRRPLVGILLFDDVEVLDFAGPYEVCGGTLDPAGESCVDVVTVGARSVVVARGGLRVAPDLDLADRPALDALIVPGGPGADERTDPQDEVILPFLREQARSIPTLASVCTGAFSSVEPACSPGTGRRRTPPAWTLSVRSPRTSRWCRHGGGRRSVADRRGVSARAST